MFAKETEVIIGIGTNQGDRKAYIEQAIELLSEEFKVKLVSDIYESKALLAENAPSEWDLDFLNLAILIETNFKPRILLQKLKEIEKQIGKKNRGFWAPREIDLDILAYGGEVIITEDLVIPHQYFLERSFALLPASEICPNWQYPVQGSFFKKTLKEIADFSRFSDCWKLELEEKQVA